MALYDSANIQEILNNGAYAPLTGISKPMVEAVVDLPTPLKAGQGVNIDAAGTVTLATDNATHVISKSHLGLTDSTYQVTDFAKAIPAVVLGQAIIDCEMKPAEVIVATDTVTFSAGQIIKAVGGEAQTFVAEAVEGNTVRIKFK